MHYFELDAADQELIEAATMVIRQNYKEGRHAVGAAVRSASGKIFTGVNISSCGAGPCAEPVAIGAAISSGEPELVACVAIAGWEPHYPVLPPCGNCRQILIDYAPDAMVIVNHNGRQMKTAARHLLPDAYRHFDATGYKGARKRV